MARKSKPKIDAPITGDPGQPKYGRECRWIFPDGRKWDSVALVVFEDGTLDNYCQSYQFGYGWTVWKRQEYETIDGKPIYKMHAVGKTRRELGV